MARLASISTDSVTGWGVVAVMPVEQSGVGVMLRLLG
jgi:hypothetical protein